MPIPDHEFEARAFSGGFAHVAEYLTQIARGAVAGATPFGGFGQITTAGAVSQVFIWPDGALVLPGPAGVQPTVVSTSALDGVGGSGATEIEIHYLDATLTQRSEVVVMNGLTPVPMVATDVRFVNDSHLKLAGASKKAAGAISVAFAGNALSQIAVGDTRCRSSMRMVPASKRLFVTALVGGMVSGTAAANGRVDFVANEIDGDQFDGIYHPLASASLQDTTATLALPMPFGPFNSGTIVGMQTTTDKGATITGSWFGWIEDIP